MHTLRGEITKWMINENIILDTKALRHLTDEQVILKYLKLVNGMNMPMMGQPYH